MSRPHIAAAVQDAKGYFQAHPERARPNEPDTCQPHGDAPERLAPEVKAVWVEVAAELLPGVGKESDRSMFELLCRLICKMRDGTAKMMEVTALISLAGQFALTPASRAK